MNLIEQLFNDFNAKYLEEAKACNIDLGLQTVYTPIDKIEKDTGFRFADHITAKTKSVAVLFNAEFIDYFIKELSQDYINNIKFTFFYDCKFDYEQVQDCIFFSSKNINIEMISIENIKDLDKVMAGKKFDVVFSNPPYNGNLDLKILKSLFEQKISDKIIFVHPAGYLLDKKFKTKLYNELRNTNYLESVNMFWGNKLFDIKLFMPCCISVWNINKISNECIINDNAISHTKYTCKINDISIHPSWINEWFKTLNFNKTLITELTPHGQLSDYSIRFGLIQGTSAIKDFYTDDFFNFTGKNVEKNKCDHTFEFSQASRDHGCVQAHWSFNNEEERENFLNYCKTKVVRFLLSFVKNGPHLGRGELEVIPWLGFTKEWNDAKLCKEFGISEELWNYIDNFIPDYYDDYESGFDK